MPQKKWNLNMAKRSIEGNLARYRIRDSRMFDENSFRTLDIGEPGKHKLIRGRLKRNRKWKTQSVTVERSRDRELRKETNEIIARAMKE